MIRPHIQRCERYLRLCTTHPERIRILALGDSWLSVPGRIWPGRSVVKFLNDERWTSERDGPAMNILSFAHPGKELADMSRDIDLHQGLTFLQDVGDGRNIDYHFQAVMVTGGGNDILPFPDRIIGPGADNNGAIREEELTSALKNLRASWNDVLRLVEHWDCPVLAHGYGPVTPTLKSGPILFGLLGVGPWIGPHLLREKPHGLGLSVERGRELISEVVDRINETMQDVRRLAWFDARRTVAQMPAEWWHDEIHFFEPGWEVLAELWLREISQRVGARPQLLAKRGKKALAKTAPLTPQFEALRPFTSEAVSSALARFAAIDTAPKRVEKMLPRGSKKTSAAAAKKRSARDG